jgi:hypothetical protein
MSRLRFDGQGAGLNERLGGNTASLADYTIICTCNSELGPVAGFRPNESGDRTVYCIKCKHITILDKDAKVTSYIAAPKEIIEKAARQTVLRINGKV